MLTPGAFRLDLTLYRPSLSLSRELARGSVAAFASSLYYYSSWSKLPTVSERMTITVLGSEWGDSMNEFVRWALFWLGAAGLLAVLVVVAAGAFIPRIGLADRVFVAGLLDWATCTLALAGVETQVALRPGGVYLWEVLGIPCMGMFGLMLLLLGGFVARAGLRRGWTASIAGKPASVHASRLERKERKGPEW